VSTVPSVEEVKPYYDAKNEIYKKEAAVSAAASHYAIFSSPFHLGSEYDFSIHKAEHCAYVTSNSLQWCFELH